MVVCVCVRACVRACVRVRVCVCVGLSTQRGTEQTLSYYGDFVSACLEVSAFWAGSSKLWVSVAVTARIKNRDGSDLNPKAWMPSCNPNIRA
eukprot:3835008-Amphidinium_carterae.1